MKARVLIVLVFLVAVGAIVAFTLLQSGGSTPAAKPDPTPVAATTVTMLYGTEKKDWIEAAEVGFEKAHPEIRVELKGMGSLDAAAAILDGKEQPTIFSPADSLVLNLLASDWDAKNHAQLFPADGPGHAEPLVITPLVYAIWEDRATVLQAAAAKANKAGDANRVAEASIRWSDIHDAVASNQGWPAIGGKSDWGFVKLGHTDPTRSNSGLQALLLMTMEFHKKTTGLTVADVLDPAYQTWVKEIEAGVPKFETSTGTFMTDMVRFGPSKFDIAVVYESLAIAQLGNAQGRWGNLKVYYPSPTIWSDHPAAILQADWVTPAQKQAAETWLAWLHSQPVQASALAYGFRPGDPSVAIQSGDANNPFSKYAAQGVKVDLPPVATPPDGAVIRNLMTMWTRVVGTR
jgi:ABC-type molybdate transport system substrate-binding protein